MPPRRPAFALPLLLGACTPASPFEGPGYDPDEGLLTDAPGPFIAVITEATIAEAGADRFDAHVERIERDLQRAPGLVGSSLRGEVFGDTAWTLSVWEDGAALGRFVGGEAHARAMADADRATDRVRTASWSLAPAAVPPSWEDALERLDAEGRAY
jgi:hypothetical protein